MENYERGLKFEELRKENDRLEQELREAKEELKDLKNELRELREERLEIKGYNQKIEELEQEIQEFFKDLKSNDNRKKLVDYFSTLAKNFHSASDIFHKTNGTLAEKNKLIEKLKKKEEEEIWKARMKLEEEVRTERIKLERELGDIEFSLRWMVLREKQKEIIRGNRKIKEIKDTDKGESHRILGVEYNEVFKIVNEISLATKELRRYADFYSEKLESIKNPNNEKDSLLKKLSENFEEKEKLLAEVNISLREKLISKNTEVDALKQQVKQSRKKEELKQEKNQLLNNTIQNYKLGIATTIVLLLFSLGLNIYFVLRNVKKTKKVVLT